MKINRSCEEIKARLDSGDELFLLDVREPSERAFCAIGGSAHIPMGEIPARLAELDRDREIVVYCHHGVRSFQVAAFLVGRGFGRVVNLAGGIDAWSLSIDPSVPRYG
ncbi:MAG: sulfurtransferase [Nitrospirae bacterium]|nr:sulfurtransferase [Nitrospirota bacterium]